MEYPSPDGQLIATVFERDCGATTAVATHACLRKKSMSFNPKKQPSFCVFEGEGKPVLIWKSQSELIVQLPPAAKVFRKNPEASKVKIDYVIGEPK